MTGGSALDWFGEENVGGVAWMNSFGNGTTGMPGGTGPQSVAPVFVFSKSLGNNPKKIWEAVSHAVGHSLGLSHDGQQHGNVFSKEDDEYYPGANGLGYDQGMTQWSKGEYPNATNTEDDVAIMSKRIPSVPDEVGDTIETAMPLDIAQPYSSVIGLNGDVDVFSFLGSSGEIMEIEFLLVNDFKSQAWCSRESCQRTNLDAEVTLYGAAGEELQRAWQEYGMVLSSFFYTAPLPDTSIYYLAIKGIGQKSASNSSEWDYTSYGSAGSCTINVKHYSSGDTRIKCGGPNENSLYEPAPIDREYIGCANDTKGLLVLWPRTRR